MPATPRRLVIPSPRCEKRGLPRLDDVFPRIPLTPLIWQALAANADGLAATDPRGAGSTSSLCGARACDAQKPMRSVERASFKVRSARQHSGSGAAQPLTSDAPALNGAVSMVARVRCSVCRSAVPVMVLWATGDTCPRCSLPLNVAHARLNPEGMARPIGSKTTTPSTWQSPPAGRNADRTT